MKKTMEHDHTPHGRHSGDLQQRLEQAPDMQLLFVGSVNCLRHKPYRNIGNLMQSGRAAILSPSMADFSAGRYLRQITDALVELSKERNCRQFLLAFGCQWVILSTDGEMLCQELKNNYDIDVSLYDDSHLESGDHA